MKEYEDHPVKFEIPVQWGEMDAARHVNNLVYLRWSESARIHYFGAIGMDQSFTGDGPILGWQDCKYIFPMSFPDTALVGVRTSEIHDDRFIMECRVYSKKHQRIAAISKQSIIPYSYEGLKKIPMPQSWIEEIDKLENRNTI